MIRSKFKLSSIANLFWILPLAILLLATPSHSKQYVMKFGHVSAPSVEADDHLMALFFKSFLENRSQGRIKVDKMELWRQLLPLLEVLPALCQRSR